MRAAGFRASNARLATRRYFGIRDDRRAVLLSFGGYGLPGIDVAHADCFDEWTIVTTDRVMPRTDLAADAVVHVEEEAFRRSTFRYEDLVAAVDAVMTKPGYGIIAECIAADRPMVYTSRGAFREYDLLVGEMQRYLRSQFISREDLYAGRWLDTLRAALAVPPAPERIATNGADVAAHLLLQMIDSA